LQTRHNDLSGLQGGSTTERYHLTSVEVSSITHANRTNLDVINQNLATTSSPSFSNETVTYGVSAATGVFTSSVTMATSGGYVGIGTLSPRCTLDISGKQAMVVSSTQILWSTNTISSASSYVNVVSSANEVVLNSNPQISAGIDGQIIYIWGTSNTNLVTLINGNGIKLNGGTNFTLGLDDIIAFQYRSGSASWCEISRSNN
jgi:hypothetical protein